ncbi:M16 family metallopeptidase [Roseivirga pacifica]|uniref:M16 family metallopeptidase n=1 Tax=Roseivirga pacifica TaxID=1267423 RepID=UPI002095C323|nr:pitrilysin family protein [Roseivirga pacifica]MCO6358378.1 insulinase family protein [Roseivirga pacifica]MCO6366158.1 insulinase family protein [Roseivirga pacifica]MCO6369291.1 insulinase family protein [Roseivirga pacifica]MCO6374109.1 insulinase family protein [Roseivirga pacifica]MCO6378485.1 insulinase family protein [Roseivirga pacifica]
MIGKIRYLLGLVLLTAVSAQAQNIQFEEYELDNGLHVILHQDNSTPIVTVSVLYHVGSKNEPPGRTGFAHFFEHLMFEGSPNIKRGEYFKIIQAAGGTLNANTSNDRTYYYETLPSNQLELGLYMESERMLHAKIDSTGIATQKEVVKEEKRSGVDNRPYGTILIEMLKNAYGGTNYEWAPIGSFEDIDAATDQDFVDFYETFYVPNNATLTIAGDIDKKEAKKLVEMYFGEIKRGTKDIPRPSITAPKLDGTVEATVFDNIQVPAVIQGYRMPPQGTEDYYALQMLTQLLSGGQSSRFQKELVDEKGMALAVQSIPLALEDGGLFINFALPNQGYETEDLAKEVDKLIEEVKTTPIPEREFQKLKNQIENNFVSGYGSVQSIAESLANYHVYFDDTELINTEIERYRKVTREDLMRVAKKYFVPENKVELTYRPKAEQEKPEDSKLKKEGGNR